MPYKDPERKRQWEQDHRQQRNARRKVQRLAESSGQPAAPRSAPEFTATLRNRLGKSAPDPTAQKKPTSGWKVLLGFAVGLGIVFLAGVAGVNVPPPGDPGGSPKSSNSGV